MRGPDIALFVVGALLFGGATAAIVTTEGGLDAIGGGGSPTGVYNVAYATRTIEGEEQAVPDFASAQPVSFDVNNTRVSRVVVVVDCTDPVPAGSTFTLSVSVEGPNGLAAEPVSGSCGGELEVPVDVAAVPPSTTVQGDTEDEARGNLPEDANATKAVGTWTVTVTGQRGGAPAPLPVGNPGGNVFLRVETWEPSFTPVPK